MPEVYLASSVARLSAVKKAAYRLTAICDTEILPDADGARCILSPARGQEADELPAIFRATALDYELREEIASKTAPYRDALLALTFAPLAKPEAD